MQASMLIAFFKKWNQNEKNYKYLKLAELTFCFYASPRPRRRRHRVMKFLRHCCLWRPHSSITSALSMSYIPPCCKGNAAPAAILLAATHQTSHAGKAPSLLRQKALDGGNQVGGSAENRTKKSYRALLGRSPSIHSPVLSMCGSTQEREKCSNKYRE